MLLTEIFDALSYGELNQVHIGGFGERGVDPANHPHILTHINLGLTELHKRFNLREGRLTLNMVAGLDTYVLDKMYALGNPESFGVPQYIQDTYDEPFLNDVLKVERVFDDKGNELALNAGDDPTNPRYVNIRTPTFNTLRVPAHLKSESLTVVYRAKHPEVIKEDTSFDPTETVVDLPYSHLEALLYYVASRVYNPIGNLGEFHEGNNYAAKFEAACRLLENQGLQINNGELNHRLIRNGWV